LDPLILVRIQAPQPTGVVESNHSRKTTGLHNTSSSWLRNQYYLDIYGQLQYLADTSPMSPGEWKSHPCEEQPAQTPQTNQ
jgi:hypothetical protein